MSQRFSTILLVVVALLLTTTILSRAQRPGEPRPIGTLARLPAHGDCIGVIAEGGVLFRAFADGTVEAYRIGSGQADWRPLSALVPPGEKK